MGRLSAPALSRALASRRVYTIALVLVVGLGVAATALMTRAPAPDAHDRISIEPRMTKGPATAAVTIIEFSDYQ